MGHPGRPVRSGHLRRPVWWVRGQLIGPLIARGVGLVKGQLGALGGWAFWVTRGGRLGPVTSGGPLGGLGLQLGQILPPNSQDLCPKIQFSEVLP